MDIFLHLAIIYLLSRLGKCTVLPICMLCVHEHSTQINLSMLGRHCLKNYYLIIRGKILLREACISKEK